MVARVLLKADLPLVAETLARAFVVDPMVTWLVGADDPAERHRRSVDGFFAPATEATFACGQSYAIGDIDGAALWAPPDIEVFGADQGAALAGALVTACGSAALDRLVALGELTGSRHPHDRPHFYLFLLGVAVPGGGRGSELMQPVLQRCDFDGLPAYLESSSARNVAFYERHGFRVRWEAAPEGGPTLRGMWREPGSGLG